MQDVGQLLGEPAGYEDEGRVDNQDGGYEDGEPEQDAEELSVQIGVGPCGC